LQVIELKHSHSQDIGLGTAFKIGIIINILFVAAEATVGYFSNSMALMADTLVSFGVVVAGIIISLTGLQWVDTVVSFVIIAVILYGSYNLLIDSVNLALDAVPENIKIESVKEYLAGLSEVTGVHDLHIWSLGTTSAALTVHLTTACPTNVSFISAIQHHLHDQFEIEHSTIQVEFGPMEDCGNKY